MLRMNKKAKGKFSRAIRKLHREEITSRNYHKVKVRIRKKMDE